MTQTPESVALTVPAAHRDPIATFIELTVEGTVFEIEPISMKIKSGSAAFGQKPGVSHISGPANPPQRESMGRAMRSFQTEGAAVEIAKEILETA